MKLYSYYFWIDNKRFLRHWQNLFFIYAYPLILVGMFGLIFVQDRSLGDQSYLHYSMPGYLAIILMSALFLGVFSELLSWRRVGTTQSFSRTPLTFAIMSSLTATTYILHSLLAQLLTIVFAWLVFKVSLPPLLPFAAYQLLLLVSVYSFSCFFYLLVRSAQLNNIVRFSLFFLTMFLSGAAIPIEIFPPVLRKVTLAIPLSYGIDLLKPLWQVSPQRSRNTNLLALLAFSAFFLLLTSLVRRLRKKSRTTKKVDRGRAP